MGLYRRRLFGGVLGPVSAAFEAAMNGLWTMSQRLGNGSQRLEDDSPQVMIANVSGTQPTPRI